MARVGSAHDLASPNPHAVGVSTGPSDVFTFTAPSAAVNPDGISAVACFISAKTTAVRVTFDGSTPDDSPANGLVLPANGNPVYFPFAKQIKFCSDVAGNSEVNVLWLA
jgi:hypothetical protein